MHLCVSTRLHLQSTRHVFMKKVHFSGRIAETDLSTSDRRTSQLKLAQQGIQPNTQLRQRAVFLYNLIGWSHSFDYLNYNLMKVSVSAVRSGFTNLLTP